MKTAMYLRKSRADAGGEVETLEKHRETLLDFAAKNNLVIIKTYEEVASGESLFARPQMLALLNDVEQGMYDAVLCMDIDRLGRGDMEEQGLIMNKFKYSSTKIITLREVYDPENEKDDMFFEFKGIIARNELKAIKRRMLQGRIKTLQDGGYVAEPPYGYERDWKEKIPTLKEQPEQAEVIRTIYDLYVNQGLGTDKISQMLNKMGYKTRKNTPFTRNTVRFILQNVTYTGKISWNKNKWQKKKAPGEKNRRAIAPKEEWIEVKGLHPAIISEELFEMAQDIRINRGHPSHNTGELKNPLAGVAKCFCCGNKLQRQHLIGEPPRLLCTTHGCEFRSLRLDLLEEKLFSSLEHFPQNTDFFKNKIAETKTTNNTAIIKKLNENRSKLQKQWDNLHDLLEQGVYSIDVFMERKHKLTEQLDKIDAELAEQTKKDIKKPNDIIPKLKELSEKYWSFSAAERNSSLKSIIDAIIITKTKEQWLNDFDIEIKWKFFL